MNAYRWSEQVNIKITSRDVEVALLWLHEHGKKKTLVEAYRLLRSAAYEGIHDLESQIKDSKDSP